MQINIQGHGIALTEALKEYVNKKIGHLEHYFNNIQKAVVILDARDNSNIKKSQVAEVSVWLAGKKVVRATAAGENMYASVDLVADELKRQVQKHKEMHIDEKRRASEKMKEELRSAMINEFEEKTAPEIVHSSKFAAKPMGMEEAREEMKVYHQDFMVFYDAKKNVPHLISRTRLKSGRERYEIVSAQDDKIKSMDIESAKTKLAKGKKIYVPFLNSQTNEFNVLYRRSCGNFGLIEPS